MVHFLAQAVTELQETLESMEKQEESRVADVDEMALHLMELRDRLNDMQIEAAKKDSASTQTEEDALRQMHQVTKTISSAA
jgi:regulator of replication initiation timing